jgi:hypothetical protein
MSCFVPITHARPEMVVPMSDHLLGRPISDPALREESGSVENWWVCKDSNLGPAD